MRDFIIHLLGGHTKSELKRALLYYEGMLKATIEKHNMYAAWEQLKVEHKERRVH